MLLSIILFSYYSFKKILFHSDPLCFRYRVENCITFFLSLFSRFFAHTQSIESWRWHRCPVLRIPQRHHCTIHAVLVSDFNSFVFTIFRLSAVKRLMREAVEMKNPTELYYCQPVEVGIPLLDNIQ